MLKFACSSASTSSSAAADSSFSKRAWGEVATFAWSKRALACCLWNSFQRAEE